MKDLLKIAAILAIVLASTFFLFERSGLITEAGIRSALGWLHALHPALGRGRSRDPANARSVDRCPNDDDDPACRLCAGAGGWRSCIYYGFAGAWQHRLSLGPQVWPPVHPEGLQGSPASGRDRGGVFAQRHVGIVMLSGVADPAGTQLHSGRNIAHGPQPVSVRLCGWRGAFCLHRRAWRGDEHTRRSDPGHP